MLQLHRTLHCSTSMSLGYLEVDRASWLCYTGVSYNITLVKGVKMILTSKHKGNIALAHALAYFCEKGYYLFLPVGDNGGSVDIVISEDGTHMQRVQCKYTTARHASMQARYPDKPVWQVQLRQTGRREKDGHMVTEAVYDENSFDWLFISAPSGDYLIQWKQLCQELGRIPNSLQLGKNAEKYRVEIA